MGCALGLRLIEQGHQVWGLRRNTVEIPHPIVPLAADLTRPNELARVPKQLTHVVYAAAADGSSDDQYRAAYVAGLANLLALPQLRREIFQQFLLVSSTAVYGQSDGSWVNESSPTKPSGFSGKRLLESEHLVSQSRLPYAILRCAGIYGPGRNRLINMVRTGRARFNPDNPRYTNRIHRDDVAGSVHHLLDSPALNRTLLGVDHEPAPMQSVACWLAEQLRVAPPQPQDSSTPGDSSRRSVSNKRCSNSQLLATGYRFRYPSYRDGYAEMLRAQE